MHILFGIFIAIILLSTLVSGLFYAFKSWKCGSPGGAFAWVMVFSVLLVIEQSIVYAMFKADLFKPW